MATQPIITEQTYAQSFLNEGFVSANDSVLKQARLSAFVELTNTGSIIGSVLKSRGAKSNDTEPAEHDKSDKSERTTSPNQSKLEKLPNVVSLPHFFKPQQIENRSVNTLQEWEGLVDSVSDSAFTARLRDLTRPNTPEEIATIPLSEVDRSDRERVIPGAIFHLFIGYTRRGGSQRRETFTYFRRHLPKAKHTGLEFADLIDSFKDDG